MRNRTIGYRIIQSVLGFLVNDCVPMDAYMTRDPCENDMFTNSNKAFINFNNFKNKWVLSFTTLNCQQARKRQYNYKNHTKGQNTSRENRYLRQVSISCSINYSRHGSFNVGKIDETVHNERRRDMFVITINV